MSVPRQKPWTVDAFFAWEERQAERHELVGGFPVRMMVGAKNVHDDIVVNLLAELRTSLRGSGCRPFTADGAVETLPGQIRRPDAGVDCGARDPNAFKAAAPRLIAEVLSPSTRDFDTFGKLEEYKSIPGLAYILLVEPNAPLVVAWMRDPDGAWTERRLEGTEASIDLPALGITLPLSAIYDGVNFPDGPRLVQGP